MTIPINELQSKLASLAIDLLNGKKPQEVSVTVTFSLPQQILDIVDIMATALKTERSVILGQIATEAINERLLNATKELKEEAPKVMPSNKSDIAATLQQFNSQFESMQQVVNQLSELGEKLNNGQPK